MITYLKGDATNPQVLGNKVIVHICNDIGGWGAGFVKALSAKWSAPEKAYRAWHDMGFYFGRKFQLGQIQIIPVEGFTSVANMVAQRGLISKDNPKPLDVVALQQCLQLVGNYAYIMNASVHMPRIGCGLAGGNWEEDVLPLIEEQLDGIDVYVYDL